MAAIITKRLITTLILTFGLGLMQHVMMTVLTADAVEKEEQAKSGQRRIAVFCCVLS